MSRTKPTHAGRSGGEIGCCTVAILNSAHPIYFDRDNIISDFGEESATQIN